MGSPSHKADENAKSHAVGFILDRMVIIDGCFLDEVIVPQHLELDDFTVELSQQ